MLHWTIFALVSACSCPLGFAEKPVFSQKYPYFFEVKEGVPKGYLIGFVNATVSDDSLTITYETSSVANHAIRINSTTGGLYVNGTIDADVPDIHDIQFTVFAYAVPDKKASISVYVIITDVNDNYPVFQNQAYRVNVSEDFPINTYVTRVQATDVDRKGLSELIYNIQGWHKGSLFTIKEFAGTIWTNAKLDYEKNQSHVLNISVTDGRPSDPSRHIVYTTVEIFVRDHDDQGAKFDSYNYYASILEGDHNGTALLQVHATDLDKGINAPVTYSILPESNRDGIYHIDSVTGLISVRGAIDRESTGSSFYLIAQAASTFHEPATATIVISINDTNDNGPVFQRGHYTAFVPENSLIGTLVMQVSAQDLDAGNNKVLAYNITGGHGKFGVNLEGYIFVNASLDRESEEKFDFQVYAYETLTSERRQASVNVTVFVKDVNDNSPVFDKSVFQVEVSEEKPPPQFLIQMNATDKDFGQNSDISYSIVPDAEGRDKYFRIESLTGKLYTANKLDRESVPSFALLIRATDHALPGQTRDSTCTVKIKVVDVNDNSPEFAQREYHTSINEAAGLNTIVTSVQAVDKDEGKHASLRYSILSSNNSDVFTIDSINGLIKTAKALDRESIDLYHLRVQATDGGNQSSSVPVTIRILDVNDNTPVFSKPDGYQFLVVEGKKGQFVGNVKAFDSDEGLSGEVKYSITNSDWFQIDALNGTITTARELDRETNSVHRLTVVAEDQAIIASRNSYAKVEITVVDVNDNPPKFAAPGSYSVVIRKDSGVGTFVYGFKAFDADLARNGQVTYALRSSYNGLFALRNDTGELRVNGSLVSWTNDSMTVTVVGTDNGEPALSSSAQLFVYFANVARNAPVVSPPSIKVSIQENAKVGTLVYDINAQYDGKSEEVLFRYSMIHGAEGTFEIHFETGKITTLRKIDREETASYTLIVTVQLRAQEEANFALVQVTVQDENDNAPTFEKNIFTVHVHENQPSNTTVTKIIASDLDYGINSKIFYSLNGSEHFAVDNELGLISTAVMLDREKIPEYNLTLTAVNALSTPVLASSCQVRIRVLDLDDNAPTFERPTYQGTIAENAHRGTSVLQVEASDLDEGTNGLVKYDLEGSKCFSINGNTGIVRSSCVIDREVNQSFTLSVTARGIAPPYLSSTAKLQITVLDVDDNHPNFTAKIFRFSPSEHLHPGSVIGNLTVTDNDSYIGRVSFELYSGNDQGFFGVHNETGELLLNKLLDRETKPDFTLQVRVYSLSAANVVTGAEKAVFDQATVFVHVRDANDNPPLFTKDTFFAAVREDATFGTFILQVHASDRDLGSFGSLVYEVASGNEQGLVSLEESTGRITLAKSLAGDAGRILQMGVTAKDNEGKAPANEAVKKATVRIQVIGHKQTGIVLVDTPGAFDPSYVSQIERILGNVIRSVVKIDRILPTANKHSFRIDFHAMHTKSEKVLDKDEIAKLLTEPKTAHFLLTNHNVTWYSGQPPVAGKSTSPQKSSVEVYIGVIASIAILLMLTCAFAIWAACSKRRGSARKNDSVSPEIETRTNTLQTFSDPVAVGSIRSVKSTNRYFIEPYESNENIEIGDKTEDPVSPSHFNESPFYIVERHEELTEGTPPSYLDSAAKPSNSWVYGESVGSTDDVDEIVAAKLRGLTESQIEFSLLNRAGPGTADDTFVSKDSLTTGGPLFTSEKLEDAPGTNNIDADIRGRPHEGTGSCDRESEEETCETDGTTDMERYSSEPNAESRDQFMDTAETDTLPMSTSDGDACSSNPFSLLSERLPEATFNGSSRDLDGTPRDTEDFSGDVCIKDVNQNEKALNLLKNGRSDAGSKSAADTMVSYL